jgi:hypothetical protein
VVLILGAIALGLGIGLALPPRTSRFARPKINLPAALAGGAVLQLLASRTSGALAVALGIGALVVLAAFALANLHLTGMGVMTIGLMTNLLIMCANSGMPVSPHALVAAGVVSAEEVHDVALQGPRHVERASDELLVLGDIIPAHGLVLSFGDLIIAVATVDVVAHVARRQRRRQPSSPDFVDLTAMRSASPDHDWGIAPSPVPSSASQYSASPDDDAPRTVEYATSAPARHNK